MVDTSALIGVIPDDVISRVDQFAASYVVRAELLRGQRRWERDPATQQRAGIRAQLVSAFDDLGTFWRPFGVEESEAYSRLAAASEAAVRSKDAFIAAHAIAAGVPLITADRGFTRFDGLEIRFV
ncbi:PIN domain-containing protein [Microbacterium sp. KUDC0406]|uniref:type II toxin-antitoxin system VapC family toxin n=1 Tax=Microbacterium sp. KUDC0406 TaxID=2909588 RepID=UPI001F3E24B1|nr:PIN domain-containing protein [Microbacterium sp. KUDC0406]UJP11180.1 PIN domain-containing protein [Microbacterium sp. KUDC0406]